MELGVFYRESKGEKTAVAESKAKLEQRGAKICLVENDIVDISSTQLRRMLAFHCAGPFLSPGVAAYIREHGLYDVNAQWKNLPMAELEQVVVSAAEPQPGGACLGLPGYGGGAGQALGRGRDRRRPGRAFCTILPRRWTGRCS